jgi:hypothetical protein
MQSHNDFLAFLIELTVLLFCWPIFSVVAQYCVLADIFGKNMFFAATDAVTTYLMHVIFIRTAITLIVSQFFSTSNTIYVGLPQMTRADIRELFFIVNTAVLFVAFF